MKILQILPFLTLLLFCACKNDDDEIISEDPYNIDIGSFYLLPESLDRIPYFNKKKAQFVDSLGELMSLEITEQAMVTTGLPSTLILYNVYAPGDTVRYQYVSNSQRFTLRNDTLDLKFDLSLTATPYYTDPTSGYVADILNIYLAVQGFNYPTTQVFYHKLNQRTWPNTQGNTSNLGEKTFFDRTFDDVLYTNFYQSVTELYFNYEFGILSFKDHEGRKWRFDKFID